MTTEHWVARLNKLAREMDTTASSLHPSAWPEALREQRERYRRLALSAPQEEGQG